MSEWSQADTNKLLKMRKAGRPWSDIAVALGRSSDSCRGHAQRVGYHEEKDHKEKIKQLEKLVDQQLESIERSRAPRKIFQRPPSSVSSGDFCRVIIPDSHGSKCDPAAIAAFLSDLEAINPRQIIMLGDHLDCGGFLATHHTLGYVAETTATFDDDVDACNHFLDEIARCAPKASVDYLAGNHERRLETWCVTQQLKNPGSTVRGKSMAEVLLAQYSAQAVLSTEKRGIHYFDQGKFYDGLPIPATIKRGKCVFTHGSRIGRNAAADMLNDFGFNVVFGHTHREDSASRRTVREGVIRSWNPGCLSLLQPLWQHTNVTGWSHGYALQMVSGNEDFLHVNVPIINGKSYLGALMSNFEMSGRRAKKVQKSLSV